MEFLFVPQMSFRGQTSGGLAKCRLFSQARRCHDVIATATSRERKREKMKAIIGSDKKKLQF